MFYFVKTPWWLRSFYAKYIWRVPVKEKTLFLTFDDGPHPVATPFVLDQLEEHDAKATFFCLGKNVVSHPEIFQRIKSEGHRIGNHTYNHMNGWKTNVDEYVQDVEGADVMIRSNLFRPPYGRVTREQAKALRRLFPDIKLIMWDVLSGDFDPAVNAAKCINRVTRSSRPGSIIVFHDSQKAFPVLKDTLPVVLSHFKNAGYNFQPLRFESAK